MKSSRHMGLSVINIKILQVYLPDAACKNSIYNALPAHH